MHRPPVTFALHERSDGPGIVLVARGELDLPNVPLLDERLRAALVRRPPRLRLDLADVTYAQASALGPIVHARRAAAAQGTEFVVVGGHVAVARLLSKTGMDVVLRPGLAGVAPRRLHDDPPALRAHQRGGDGSGAPRLRVEGVRRGDAVVLRLAGELDHHGSDGLERRLAEALGAGSPVVVDLAALAFCDTQGLAGLVRAARIARGDGVRLAVAGPNRPVRRLLEVTGTARLLAPA